MLGNERISLLDLQIRLLFVLDGRLFSQPVQDTEANKHGSVHTATTAARQVHVYKYPHNPITTVTLSEDTVCFHAAMAASSFFNVYKLLE